MPTTHARTYNVKGQSFESHLTDSEAIALCRELRSNFAADLVYQHDSNRRPLTGNQWAWVHKLATDEQRRRDNQTRLDIFCGDVQPILDLFIVAKGRLKRPKIHLLTENDLALRLTVAGPNARYPGSINVTSDAKFGESVWYGRIQLDGTFEPSSNCVDDIIEYLTHFASDPAGVAAADGRRSGRCCFCNMELNDARSLEVGYGPKCAENYDLPWGNKRRGAE